MTVNPVERRAAAPSGSVTEWLLDSDPSIRWQVMRDLLGAPDKEVTAERARVATEGAGARLLAHQGADGSWAGAAWNRGWDSTMHVLRGRAGGGTPDVAEARLRGPMELHEGERRPSRWITLRALRVLDWHSAGGRT